MAKKRQTLRQCKMRCTAGSVWFMNDHQADLVPTTQTILWDNMSQVGLMPV